MFPKIFPLLAALVLALATHAGAQSPPAGAPDSASVARQGVRPLLDLPYVTGGHHRQRLDLYLPEKSTGLRPLVVWIHGGAWSSGSKSEFMAKPLVDHGYAVASIEYRFIQDAIFPAQLQDCKAALRWLRAHAAEYEIDPTRIGAWGASAGGHLVALLATTGTTRDFDVGENLDQSSSVQCVIDWFGPSDFLHWENAEKAGFDRADSVVSRLFGGTVKEKSDLARRASPVALVSKEAAPFLIMHGDKDTVVPLQQSELLNEALQKAGVETSLIVIPGSGHGSAAFVAPEQVLRMASFLDQHLHPGAALSAR